MKYIQTYKIYESVNDVTLEDYIKYFNYVLPELNFYISVDGYIYCNPKNNNVILYTHWNTDEFNYKGLKKWCKKVQNDDDDYNSHVIYVARVISEKLEELKNIDDMDVFLDSKELGLL